MCIFIYIYICIYVCMYMYMYIYACMYVHVYIYIYQYYISLTDDIHDIDDPCWVCKPWAEEILV